MKTRELQELLLTHYLFAIEEVKKADESDPIEELLRSLHVHCGVCNCALLRFKVDIYQSEWVSKYEWPQYPIWQSKQEAIELLQIRVTNLQNELQ